MNIHGFQKRSFDVTGDVVGDDGHLRVIGIPEKTVAAVVLRVLLNHDKIGVVAEGRRGRNRQEGLGVAKGFIQYGPGQRDEVLLGEVSAVQ